MGGNIQNASLTIDFSFYGANIVIFAINLRCWVTVLVAG